MFYFNVDLAVECIKSIIVNTQCVTCDKLIGPCVRFPCGHSVCKDCAEREGECLFCISPPSYLIDKPQTARLNNAAVLLNAFQDTFNIDVYKRQRVSDHLRVEKLVFPECIQAPHKYSNKRKSLNNSFKNKENISPKNFSGEDINRSNKVTMKKSAQYVQNWLNQHESVPQNPPRRPFGDININTQSLVPKSKQGLPKLKKVTAPTIPKKSTYRVRSHLKTIHKSPSLSKNEQKKILEIKNQPKKLEIKKEKTLVDNQIHQKCEKNESGIVLDDEPIVIEEDLDTNIIDKDEQAWLAVLEAAKKDEYEDKEMSKTYSYIEQDSLLNVHKMAESTLIVNENNSEKIESGFPNKVLFFKRSSLFETCKLCKNNFKTKISSNSEVNKSNDVSIVINNSAFVTTMKFTKCEDKKLIIDKTSTAIQTDEDILLGNEMNKVDEKITPQKRIKIIDTEVVPKKMLKPNDISQSLDVFATEKDTKQDSSDNSLKRRKCLIIEDSDTDSNISCNNTHEVVVDVHTPSVPESVEFGILRTLSKMEYEKKTKRQVRGHTPNSSNSSNKENFDPNRKKKVKSGKKHKNKK